MKRRYLLKLSFIFNRKKMYERIFVPLESSLNIFTKYLVTKWDKPLKSFYISNNVINKIELYCLLIIDNFPTFVEQKKAINFFFEEFILLLNPEMKDRLKYYQQICFDYMYKINSQPKEEEEEEEVSFPKKIKNFKTKNSLFLLMVLIHIKIRYGDYNPVILFNISKRLDCSKEIFMSYVDCLHENLSKKEIIDNFLLLKTNLSHDLEFNSNYYVSYYFYKLQKRNHSFLFKSGLNIIPHLKLHLIRENDKENIFYLIDAIISKKVYFLDFLKEDYRSITEDALKSAIKLLKSISKICFNKCKEKEKNINNKRYEFTSINPNDIIFIKSLDKIY
jgi:hypothetical protein